MSGSAEPVVSIRCVLAEQSAARLVHAHVRELRRQSGLCRVEDADGIHDMRVASRRLRAALMAHSPFLDAGALAAFQEQVKRITGGLGRARELDVSTILLERCRRPLAGPARRSATYLLRHLRAMRQGECLAVRQAADLVDTPAFNDSLDALCASISARGKCYLDAARDQLRQRAQATARCHARWRKDGPEERLHRLRVHFKKLRYCCEAFGEVYGEPMTRIVKAMKRIQQDLGDWNDARIVRNYVTSLAADAPEDAAEGMPMLYEHVNKRAEKHLQAFSGVVDGFFAQEEWERLTGTFGRPAVSCCARETHPGVDR